MTASAASPARPPRRERSATESLLSVVLILEAIVVVFGMLVVFGLRVVEPVVAFTGGAALILLLVLATRIVRYPWGQWVGHGLQLVLLATVLPRDPRGGRRGDLRRLLDLGAREGPAARRRQARPLTRPRPTDPSPFPETHTSTSTAGRHP